MHVHTDVDIVHEVASARDFEFLAVFVAIYTSEDDVTFPERLWIYLPLARETLHTCFRLKTINHHLGDVEFGRLSKNIYSTGSHKSIQVRFLNDIMIIKDVTLEADMGKLLNDMRSSTS